MTIEQQYAAVVRRRRAVGLTARWVRWPWGRRDEVVILDMRQ